MTFGLNPIRKAELDLDGAELHVEEVFLTIQGEGPFSGQRAVFIRLAGCSLACYWCDTFFEAGMNRPRVTVDELVARVDSLQPITGVGAYSRPLVVITGGEPMRQNIKPLCAALVRKSYQVQIETAGVHYQALGGYSEHVTIVLSPKTPKLAAGWVANPETLRHWKYVVDATDTSVVDGLPVLSTQSEGAPSVLARPWDYKLRDYTVWVSPRDVHGAPERNRMNVQHAVSLCIRYGYRLSLQTHKLVGVP